MDREQGPENLRSITHDMRNLLTAVRGHAELALRAIAPDDPAREDVAHVVVVTAAVFELVDQIDGNDSSSSLMSTNLDGSVVGMRRLLESLLPSGIELTLQLEARGARVAVPKLRIERMVLNLALNARDAMGDSGQLTVTTAANDEEAGIRVADSGPGFTEKALEHLFESGFTTKGDRGGSGHGLFALKGIVDRAGGSIAVESEPGEGATIIILLPLAVEEEQTAESAKRPTAAAKAAAAAEPEASGDEASDAGPGPEAGAAGDADSEAAPPSWPSQDAPGAGRDASAGQPDVRARDDDESQAPGESATGSPATPNEDAPDADGVAWPEADIRTKRDG